MEMDAFRGCWRERPGLLQGGGESAQGVIERNILKVETPLLLGMRAG
jgi:hypothetical protein